MAAVPGPSFLVAFGIGLLPFDIVNSNVLLGGFGSLEIYRAGASATSMSSINCCLTSRQLSFDPLDNAIRVTRTIARPGRLIKEDFGSMFIFVSFVVDCVNEIARLLLLETATRQFSLYFHVLSGSI